MLFKNGFGKTNKHFPPEKNPSSNCVQKPILKILFSYFIKKKKQKMCKFIKMHPKIPLNGFPRKYMTKLLEEL